MKVAKDEVVEVRGSDRDHGWLCCVVLCLWMNQWSKLLAMYAYGFCFCEQIPNSHERSLFGNAKRPSLLNYWAGLFNIFDHSH